MAQWLRFQNQGKSGFGQLQGESMLFIRVISLTNPEQQGKLFA